MHRLDIQPTLPSSASGCYAREKLREPHGLTRRGALPIVSKRALADDAPIAT